MVCQTVSREELQALMQQGKEYVLIDVRERWEIEKYGAINSSKNIPLSEFQQALDLNGEAFLKKYGFEWHRDDRAIFYCRSGSRSGRACAYALSRGYHASNFTGSVLAWSQIDPNVKAY